MPSYKFQYFDVRGRGELARYVFTAAGKDFEDIILTGEDWAKAKDSTPFGQLPVLEVDGKKLAQSNSIARFLAREFDLAGKTSWDQALVDQYLELAEDLFTEAVKVVFEKDEATKAEKQKNLTETLYPKYLGFFERALKENGGKYLIGDKMSVADLAVLNVFDTPMLECETMMDKFPILKTHRAAIAGTPNMAKYLKARKPSKI